MNTLLTYFIFCFSFNSSFNLSNSEEIGLNAQQLTYSASNVPGDVALQIVFVKYDTLSQKTLVMTDAELLSYSKSTFLGTSKPAESHKDRTILGNNSVGEVLKTKIPTPSNIEVHLITLKNGDKYAIAFKSVSTLDSIVLEQIISEITESLTLK